MSESKKKQKIENWTSIQWILEQPVERRAIISKEAFDLIKGKIKKTEQKIKVLKEDKKLYRDFLRELKTALKGIGINA